MQHGTVVSRAGFFVPAPVRPADGYRARPEIAKSVDERGFYVVRYRYEWEFAEDVPAADPDLS